MTDALIWLALVSGYAFSRIGETRLHRSNYDFLTFAGGEERIPRLMTWYYRIIYFLFPVAFAEWLYAPSTETSSATAMMGLMLVGAAWGLRFWAISALGRQWSMRCIVLPGAPLVDRGPYRFLKHPEYLSRLIDGAGICLFLGARYTGAAYVIIMLLFTTRILRSERVQLTRLTPEPWAAPPRRPRASANSG